jgi:hypothetical protein
MAAPRHKPLGEDEADTNDPFATSAGGEREERSLSRILRANIHYVPPLFD